MKELSEVLKDWEAVIGLEIHTELTTLDTKMFCGCKIGHDDEPNTNVCPVCLGLPGALPVPNERAIEYIVKAGLATNCEIQKHSMFYRKHYFYPDMAKNFQTTQGPVAFAMHGRLDLEVTGRGAAPQSARSARSEMRRPRALPARAPTPWASRPRCLATFPKAWHRGRVRLLGRTMPAPCRR